MNIDNIIKLLSAESTTEEERQKIQDWISENQENVQALNELRNINSIREKGEDYQQHNVDEAWVELQAGIRNHDNNKVIPLYKQSWARIAAVMFFVVAGLFIFQESLRDGTLDSSPKEYVTEISSKTVLLNDGSEVMLDKLSSLEETSNRQVKLKGQAYFDIEKDDDNPFVISTTRGEIIVVGTEFNVISLENLVEIYVTEGIVEYLDGYRKIVLKVGDYIKVIDGDIIKLKNTDKNYLSWKSDQLIFRDATLTEVVSTLERHFDQKILIKDQNAKTICKLTSTFKNQNFKEILTELKTLLGLKYTKDGDVIEIIGAKC